MDKPAFVYYNTYKPPKKNLESKMKKITVIMRTESDLSSIMTKITNVKIQTITPGEIVTYDFSDSEAICILGGTSSSPLVLPARARICIEKEIESGKRVFAEYLSSICDTYSDKSKVPSHTRMSYLGDDSGNLKKNDILDDQSNDTLNYHFKYDFSYPLLVYKHYIMAHSNAVLDEVDKQNHTKWALWMLKDNVMLCSFRLCNFITARFTPVSKWQSLVEYIFRWLGGTEIVIPDFPTAYRLNDNTEPFDAKVKNSVSRAVSWYKNSGMLVNGGEDGILEGLSHIIDADGKQSVSEMLRADCCGEASLAFYTQYKLANDTTCLDTFHKLQRYIFEGMQINGTCFDGMIRWTETAWGVCYQDDVARAIIPTILYTLYEKDDRYLNNITRALDFLVKTTPKNGIRPARTDNLLIYGSDEVEKLGDLGNNVASAHYNAYYHAALLMAYKLSSNESYKEVAINGLETLMALYPDTVREQSETEELCRLILPLAWLFHTTGGDKHRSMLYRVTEDLQRLKKFDGAYLEWDTGYKAHCSKKENSESSLLADNGDPICDFLYSMNWLPLGFSQAYLITSDDMFYKLWFENAEFFASAQILSENQNLNGIWARGFDPEMREYYGMPHDVGWGPWAVETGWTVGEIASGLGLGLLYNELKPFYK